MTPEPYTPPEARPEGFETTAEGATRMAKEAGGEEEKYSADHQKVIDAFDAMAVKDENYKKIVDGLKERGIFEGKGDAYEQILVAMNSLKEKGVTEEQIDEALNKQVSKMVERMSDLRAAA
jgi:hypothetical protein